MTVLTPKYMQKKGISAKLDRHLLEDFLDGEGVLGPADLGAATTGNLTASVAAGSCAVRGDTNPDQGLYVCENDAAVVMTHDANEANPRIDQCVMRVYDSQEAGGVTDLAQLELVKGTATGGTTLDTRNGVAAQPLSSMLVYDALVPATSGAMTIRDRRPFAMRGNIPPRLTAVVMAAFEPGPGVVASQHQGVSVVQISHAQNDLKQAVALMYLPRRIVGATRIRWRYAQDGTTALTGNYNIGIYDASGRKVVETGGVAFAGGIGTVQAQSVTIAATTFEAGLYYVMLGVDTGAGSAYYLGVQVLSASFNGLPGSNLPNSLLISATGGVALPTTILGLTDAQAAALANYQGVPLIGLSVG